MNHALLCSSFGTFNGCLTKYLVGKRLLLKVISDQNTLIKKMLVGNYFLPLSGKHL